MKKLISIMVIGFVLWVFSAGIYAQPKVVVIPLGGDIKPGNLIIVAPSGGDFDNPVDAVNSIKDASQDKQYIVYIMPGIYELTSRLVMQPYVDVVGSGHLSSDLATHPPTILTGSLCGNYWNEGSAMVVGTSYSSISSLIIKNTCSEPARFCFGYFALDPSPVTSLSDLQVSCEGASSDTGIYITEAPVLLFNVTSIAKGISGSLSTRGVFLNFSVPTGMIMRNVNIKASGGSTDNTGFECNKCDLAGAGYNISYSQIEGDDQALTLSESALSIDHSALKGDNYINTLTGNTLSCQTTDWKSGVILDPDCRVTITPAP